MPNSQPFQRTRFRPFFAMAGLCVCAIWPILMKAQSLPNERERAGFWASKGQGLMRASQYSEAYTAFQLARSLGAANMASQMELAKKRNINSIQLRALLAEARAQASNDPTQSLRLLEYARSKFPDTTAILKAIGEVANQPDNWYYTLRADSIKASPRFSYLLVDTDKSRLYARRGDSLKLLHTFAERPVFRVFSPDDRHLFVTTGERQKGLLYALGSSAPTLVASYGDSVSNMQFSPGFSPAWNYLLIEYNNHRMTLYHHTVPILGTNFMYYSNAKFSPTGQYFNTTDGLWQITGMGVRSVPLQPSREGINDYNHVRFSDHDRNLLVSQRYYYTGTWEDGNAEIKSALYRLPDQPVLKQSEQNDTVRIERLFRSSMKTPRPRWTPFSPDGRYYCLKGRPDSSLFFNDNGQWQPISLAASIPDSIRKGDYVDVRFSPDKRHMLVAYSRDYKQRFTQLWRLDGQQTRLIYVFQNKPTLHNDVFSADGAYLLARHTDAQTDRLWHITNDTVRLVHVFRKPLQLPTVFDADGFPVHSPYFSPDGRHLITYAATALTADSLWQIDKETVHPLHGFGNRLKANFTAFSPDGRYVLVRGNGVQPATVWNLPMQQSLIAPNLLSSNEALFSPKGNYLLTDSTAWRVTDRGLLKLPLPVGFPSLLHCRFSPDEQYLVHSPVGADSTPIRTTLYQFSANEMRSIRETESHKPAAELMEGTVTVQTFMPGLFAPDGSGWLSALSPIDSVSRFRPDTVWKLPSQLTPGKAIMLGKTTHRIDKFILNPTAWYSVNQQWNVSPAALFSRDGRFLLAKEQESLRFYSMKPAMSAGTLIAADAGWPTDVSAGADYWLTRLDTPNEFVVEIPINERYKLDYGLADTPDAAQLWRRTGANWKSLATFTNLYYGMNLNWLGHRRQSWFSPNGNYLLVPTRDPDPTTLFSVVGDNLRPIIRLNAQLLSAAWIGLNSAIWQDVGLLYTTTGQQTYLLRHSTNGTRTIPLGFGTLHHPPRFSGKLAYWVRKIDESQQNMELLDIVSGSTLVKIPFGSVLDFAVRPNGDAWVVSTTGARLIRSPETTLRWLRQSPVAPLQPALRQTYTFL